MEMAIPSCRVFMLENDRLRWLIREAKGGSIDAFGELIELRERQVLRLAQRLLSDREAARDAAQDVFLRLHRRLSSIKEDQELTPWLYRTTINVCFDALRKTKRELALDSIAEPFSTTDNPEQAVLVGQQRRLIFAALHALSPRERETIVLRELEGYATAEVAQLLGSSETTVRSQISTARVKMRKFMIDTLRRPR